MSADPRADLLVQLRRMRALIDRPQTNLVYSHYDSVQQALDDVDGIVRDLETRTDQKLHDLAGLFLPTSSMQELAMDSGWGNEFGEIADHCDALFAALRKQGP